MCLISARAAATVVVCDDCTGSMQREKSLDWIVIFHDVSRDQTDDMTPIDDRRRRLEIEPARPKNLPQNNPLSPHRTCFPLAVASPPTSHGAAAARRRRPPPPRPTRPPPPISAPLPPRRPLPLPLRRQRLRASRPPPPPGPRRRRRARRLPPPPLRRLHRRVLPEARAVASPVLAALPGPTSCLPPRPPRPRALGAPPRPGRGGPRAPVGGGGVRRRRGARGATAPSPAACRGVAPGHMGRGEGAAVRPRVGGRAPHAAPRGAHQPRHGHRDGEVGSLLFVICLHFSVQRSI